MPQSATATFALTVDPASAPPLVYAAGALPNVVVGQASTDSVGTASGGTPPYSYAVTAGSLPPGLALDAATGNITGTPTAAGTASFDVTVTDSGA